MALKKIGAKEKQKWLSTCVCACTNMVSMQLHSCHYLRLIVCFESYAFYEKESGLRCGNIQFHSNANCRKYHHQWYTQMGHDDTGVWNFNEAVFPCKKMRTTAALERYFVLTACCALHPVHFPRNELNAHEIRMSSITNWFPLRFNFMKYAVLFPNARERSQTIFSFFDLHSQKIQFATYAACKKVVH